MANSDSQRAAGGWRTAGGWSSWGGWEDRRIDYDAMVKRAQQMEERISCLEEEVAALRQARQADQAAAVAAPVLPELKAHGCDWHENRAHSAPLGEAIAVSGVQETDPNAWLAHLRDTLYSEDSRPLDAFEGKIRAHWQCIEVTACRTQANRSFHVRCKKCDQYSYGRFGWWADGQDSAGGARDDLAKFFKAQVPPGKRKV